VNEKRTVLGYLGSIHQGEQPDPAAADLVALFLDDENPEVLGEAAYYVGYLGGRRQFERVAGLMSHEHEDIRNLACTLLPNMKSK
jgi:HEAT repeat protein